MSPTQRTPPASKPVWSKPHFARSMRCKSGSALTRFFSLVYPSAVRCFPASLLGHFHDAVYVYKIKTDRWYDRLAAHGALYLYHTRSPAFVHLATVRSHRTLLLVHDWSVTLHTCCFRDWIFTLHTTFVSRLVVHTAHDRSTYMLLTNTPFALLCQSTTTTYINFHGSNAPTNSSMHNLWRSAMDGGGSLCCAPTNSMHY